MSRYCRTGGTQGVLSINLLPSRKVCKRIWTFLSNSLARNDTTRPVLVRLIGVKPMFFEKWTHHGLVEVWRVTARTRSQRFVWQQWYEWQQKNTFLYCVHFLCKPQLDRIKTELMRFSTSSLVTAVHCYSTLSLKKTAKSSAAIHLCHRSKLLQVYREVFATFSYRPYWQQSPASSCSFSSCTATCSICNSLNHAVL